MKTMASASGYAAEDHIAGRAWPATRLQGPDEQLDDGSVKALMAVSLGIGLLSTLATSFAFYWFVKMRRTFRHE
jgi:hypothetical protein